MDQKTPSSAELAPLATVRDAAEPTAGGERLAVLQEIVPGTLRSLYLLRIGLYVLAAGLGFLRVMLVPIVAAFLLDLLTDTPAARIAAEGWIGALRLLVSGVLAATLALVLATFLIQARIVMHARRDALAPEGITQPGKAFALQTIGREAVVALITGAVTFGLGMLLAPDATTTAIGCGLLAAVAAGALDTLYFHLLFLLREAPVHAAEKNYRDVLEQAQQRLADGSMRLHEALVSRFEADNHRTVVVNKSAGGSRRQVRAARRQLRARLWVINSVIPGNRLMAFPAQAKLEPDLLERWTEEVDWLVNATNEVRRRRGFMANLLGFLHPGSLARETMAERDSFAGTA